MYNTIYLYWKLSSGKSTLSIHPELVIIRDIRLAAQFLNVVILIVVASRPNNHIQLYIMMDIRNMEYMKWWSTFLECSCYYLRKYYYKQQMFPMNISWSCSLLPPPSPVVGSNVWWVVLQYSTLGPLLPWPTWFVVTLLSNIYKAAITVVIHFRYILSMIYILI